MCDYSLMHFPNRLAREGEELVTKTFFSRSRGFISVNDLPDRPEVKPPLFSWAWFAERLGPDESQAPTAVCIPPGATLRFSDVPVKLQRRLGVGQCATVRFEQLGLEATAYRDAVRFDNGTLVSVQSLLDGMRAQVVSLGDAAETIDLHPNQESAGPVETEYVPTWSASGTYTPPDVR